MAKIDKKDLDRAWKVIHEGLEPGAKSLARLIAEALIEAREATLRLAATHVPILSTSFGMPEIDGCNGCKWEPFDDHDRDKQWAEHIIALAKRPYLDESKGKP
jgi:hypothetical protein